MEKHFVDGKSWQSTDYYERVVAEIKEGKVKWGCSSIEQFHERLDDLDDLYWEIAENGYKQQAELCRSDEDRSYAWEEDSPFFRFDEVTVCIDRDGRFLLRDGKHRLSIAKVLELKEIPVVVGLRHQKWVEFRRELQNWIQSLEEKELMPLPHPDLEDISVSGDDGRYKLIADSLPLTRGKLLELGGFLGYYSHRFEAAGFDCTTVGCHSRHTYFTEKLRDAQSKDFKIFRGPSVANLALDEEYDVVVVCEGFADFLTDDHPMRSFRQFLRRIEPEFLFIDLPFPKTYKNMTRADTIDCIHRNTSLGKVSCLGSSTEERQLYMFS
jgi:hypothetical protein